VDTPLLCREDRHTAGITSPEGLKGFVEPTVGISKLLTTNQLNKYLNIQYSEILHWKNINTDYMNLWKLIGPIQKYHDIKKVTILKNSRKLLNSRGDKDSK
jgi:hypothetical protein